MKYIVHVVLIVQLTKILFDKILHGLWKSIFKFFEPPKNICFLIIINQGG